MKARYCVKSRFIPGTVIIFLCWKEFFARLSSSCVTTNPIQNIAGETSRLSSQRSLGKFTLCRIISSFLLYYLFAHFQIFITCYPALMAYSTYFLTFFLSKKVAYCVSSFFIALIWWFNKRKLAANRQKGEI